MIAIHSLAVLLLAVGIDARTLSYETQSADFSKYGGLYQSTYDRTNDRLFLTNSVGRPPVNQSDLIEVDPKSLAVVRDVQPAIGTTGNVTQRYAVYGVDSDYDNNRVWVTNTRQGTVSYYNGKDLSLGVQYPDDIQPHPRDVYVDQSTGLAYVSSARSSVIAVFDASTTDKSAKSINISESLGKNFSSSMSLVADEVNKVLYTVALKQPLAAAIDLNDYSVKSFDLGDNVKFSSGVAWDSRREQLFVTNQGSNNTVIVNPKSGKVVKSIDMPGRPLNARYDPVYDVVYVACRAGHSVVVIDPEDYSIITQLNVTTPNHIEVAPNGDVFVTDKSSKNMLYKFTPIKSTSTDSGSSSSLSSAADASASGKSSASGNSKSSGTPKASGSSKGTASAAPNAASVLQVPVAVGAIAAAALLI